MESVEQIINELSETLVKDWDAAADWGRDPFTEMMCEEVTPEQNEQRRKAFEATCYYCVQQLMYGDVGKEIIEKISKARGDI